MSLKYALPLTPSDRQFLTRIAQGRGGPPRPTVRQAVRARALLKCDAGETDAAVATALDVSAGSVGRWCRQAVAEGPAAALVRRVHPRPCQRDSTGEAHLLPRAQSAPPAGYARWTLRLLARELAAREIGPRISYETVRWQWRTAVDWAHQVKALVDHPRYREAERLILVCDNLNPHAYASFFRAFPRAEAEHLVRRVQLVFTPQHGSWLNMAEPELSVLTSQALSPRRPTQEAVHAQVTA